MNNNVETGFEIKITDSAVKQFLQIMKDNGIPEDYALRITLSGNKHSGISYQIGFDSQLKDTDTVITYPELKFLFDSESLPTLTGTLIDFKEDGCCGGFVFNNPNAVNKCGCHD